MPGALVVVAYLLGRWKPSVEITVHHEHGLDEDATKALKAVARIASGGPGDHHTDHGDDSGG